MPFGVVKVLVVLFVDFRLASGGQSKFLGERPSLNNGMVCPGLS